MKNRLPSHTPLIMLAALLLLFSFHLTTPVYAATFIVDTVAGDDDGFCDATDCSFAEAVKAANASPGTDTIEFSALGIGPHAIDLTTTIQAISESVIIDGTIGTGGSCSATPVPMIELNGQNIPVSGPMLDITASNVTIRGLIINQMNSAGDSGLRMQTGGTNVIECNYFGTDATGLFSDTSFPADFNLTSIIINNSNNNIIRYNTIVSRNLGISITGTSSGNKVQGNFIGTGANGAAQIPSTGVSGRSGIIITGASNNIIGVDGDGSGDADERNVISGNPNSGLQIISSASGNVVAGNYIGVNNAGTGAIANGTGVIISSSATNNRIGTNGDGPSDILERNVISGNTIGVSIQQSGTTGNTVAGNYIGVDSGGASALANTSDGVRVDTASTNTIGGASAAFGNTISGNGANGVRVMNGATAVTIGFNIIGTDELGTSPVANPVGISLESGANTVSDNLISGNTTAGISIASGSSSNIIQNNFIGTDISLGDSGVGNPVGILINSSSNTISLNTIAYNTGHGVSVQSGTANTISENSMFNNGGRPIALGAATPANDNLDPDTGPNNQQNFPVIFHATQSNGGNINFDLNSSPNTTFTIEFFATAEVLPTTDCEMETFLGSMTVTTNASGNSINNDFGAAVPNLAYISATATDAAGNTSEISVCRQEEEAPIFTFTPDPLPAAYVGVAFSQTVTASTANVYLPYTYAHISGTLPAWMTFNPATRVLSGTPPSITPPEFFTIQVTDARRFKGTIDYTATVTNPPTITVNPATLPNGGVGLAYSQTISASGSSNLPFTFTHVGGTLPNGLTLDTNTGVLSGTPTTAGNFTFTIRATDGGGFFAERTYTNVNIAAAPTFTFTPGTLPQTWQGIPAGYTQSITVGGGTSPIVAWLAAADMTSLNNAGLTTSPLLSTNPATPTTLPGGVVQIIGAGPGNVPNANGVANFTLNIQDAIGFTATRAYSVTVNPTPTITFSGSTTLPGTVQTLAYNSGAVNVVGGSTATYTFNLVDGASIGCGLIFDSTTSSFTITGTTSCNGTITFDVRATDGNGFQSALTTFSITVAPTPVITLSSTLTDTFVGAVYNRAVTASATGGVTLPYTFIVGGPDGAALSGGGIFGLTGTTSSPNFNVTGSPSAPGTINFSLQARDANGFTSAVENYTINITAVPTLTFTPGTLPNTIQNIPAGYNQMITIGNGTAPYSVCITAPDQASLNAAGLTTIPAISTTCAAPTVLAGGTLQIVGAGAGNSPNSNGTATFTITAIDSTTPTPITTGRTYTVVVAPQPTITVNPATLPNTVQNRPLGYSQTVSAVGGSTGSTYTFSVSAGALPTGLTLNSTTGVISGTPTAAGTFNFTIRATDGNAFFGERAYTIVVAPQPTLTITSNPAPLENRVPGVLYNATFTAAGGASPYTFNVVAGNSTLTAVGLSIQPDTASSVKINATTTASGNVNFTLRATDADGFFVDQVFTFAIQPITFSQTTVPNGSSGLAYPTQTITVSGGDGTYTLTKNDAGLAGSGLTLDVTTNPFMLSGTAATTGNYTFSVTANDGNGGNVTQNYSLSISAPVITITAMAGATPLTTLSAVENVAMSTVTFSASGGVTTGPGHRITAITITPSVPTGLNIAGLNTNAATLSGTPAAGTAGTYSVKVDALDGAGNPGTRTYTLTISATGVITIQGNNLNGTIGVPYTGFFTASGGTAPYLFCLAGGTLPTGITGTQLPACPGGGNGTLGGTPTALQTRTIQVRAIDVNGSFRTQSFTITILPPTVTVAPATLPNGTVGAAYSQTITASGGTAPYTFAVTAGALPAGLTLNATTGVISGTPTTVGPVAFTITATDANGIQGSNSYVVDIAAVPPLTVNPATLPNGVTGQAYNQTVSATGGTAPYTFTITSGALPDGLTLNTTTGVISGTPINAAIFTFTVTARDSATPQALGTRSYSVQIVAANAPGFGSNPAPGTEITFGVVPAGQSIQKTIVVSETGGSALTVFTPPGGPFGGLNPGDYAIIGGNPPFTINDGGSSVVITISCSPQNSLAPSSATLTLNSNDPFRPVNTYFLKCNDTTPPISGTPTPGATPGEAVPPTGIAPGVSVITVLTQPPEAVSGTAAACKANVVVVRGLALRSGPYLGATMLGIIRPKKDYMVLAQNDGDGQGQFKWYLVVDVDNDRVGWASGRYMTLNCTQPVPTQTTIFDTIDNTRDVGVRVTTYGNVNIRPRPSLRTTPMKVTPWGAELVVLGRTMQAGEVQWLHVKYTDENGTVLFGWIYWAFDSPELVKLTSPIALDAVPIR